ncbi:MAG: hypothetical protein M3522_07440 [Actinomycetota bacterium]|nr:hypothetical protein [Actinomycetota bacterium]
MTPEGPPAAIGRPNVPEARPGRIGRYGARRRTLLVLALATAIGSAGLAAGGAAGAPIAGGVVAFGGTAALSLAGTVVATPAALALALVRKRTDDGRACCRSTSSTRGRSAPTAWP